MVANVDVVHTKMFTRFPADLPSSRRDEYELDQSILILRTAMDLRQSIAQVEALFGTTHFFQCMA